jgi:hypothetical protein
METDKPNRCPVIGGLLTAVTARQEPQVCLLFSAYIACLSPLGILERNSIKNSSTSHPSCRLLPRHLFLTELTEKHFSFLFFLIRSFSSSACEFYILFRVCYFVTYFSSSGCLTNA